MKPYYKLLDVKALLFGFSALLLLASCGSYQYAGYDNDGIYSSGQYDQTEAYTANDYEESYEDALYYKQLFSEKSEEFASVPEEGAIFTDIDTYSSGSYDGEYIEEDLGYATGRPAWGSDPDEISINIYQDPFYRPYYYPYYAGMYGPFWGDPFYYNYMYRYPHYGYGYYSSWNFGFGYSWNTYRYFHPYYGGYYHPYYYGNGYHYPRYDRSDVAYSTSRRGSYEDYYNRSRERINSDSRSTRVRSYLNPRDVRADRSNYDRRTYQTRTSRVRSDATPVRRNSTYSRGRSSREIRGVQNRGSRSQSPTMRSSSPRRSSGTVRSSSSSSRSSGSSGRSSRGRGN